MNIDKARRHSGNSRKKRASPPRLRHAARKAEPRSLFEPGKEQRNFPHPRSPLGKVFSRRSAARGFRVAHDFSGVDRKTIPLNAHRIGGKVRDERDMILLAIKEANDRARERQKS